jgi:hypothetical protein
MPPTYYVVTNDQMNNHDTIQESGQTPFKQQRFVQIAKNGAATKTLNCAPG